jgi:DHA1 family multidrug resistance protein-like MFS transporter
MMIYAGILYIFITSYEVIFIEKYGFNLGENGLAFLVRSSMIMSVLRF